MGTKIAFDDRWIAVVSKKRGCQDNRNGSLKPLFQLERRWTNSVRKRQNYQNQKAMAYTIFYFFFFKIFLRPMPARTIKPDPTSSMLAGSGTGINFEAISKTGFCFKIPFSQREELGFAATRAAGPSFKPQATCWLSRI